MIDYIIIAVLIALIISATTIIIKRKNKCSCGCTSCQGCPKHKEKD